MIITPERFEQAREAYVQMKTCTVLAALFACFGVFIFAMIYHKYIARDVYGALKDLSPIGIVIMPFIPSIILTLSARRFEKRYLALMKPE